MTADPPPVEPIRREFTVDELCEFFEVPVPPKAEPGHVMTRKQYKRIKEQT